MTLDAMVFKIFCERDVSDAGTLRCGRFCDAGIASVACINLYPFFGSILLYLIILIARNVLHLPELQSRKLLMVMSVESARCDDAKRDVASARLPVMRPVVFARLYLRNRFGIPFDCREYPCCLPVSALADEDAARLSADAWCPFDPCTGYQCAATRILRVCGKKYSVLDLVFQVGINKRNQYFPGILFVGYAFLRVLRSFSGIRNQ